MGLGFDIGKDLGSFAVVLSAGFVIHRMWTKPLTTFDKVFISIGLLGFVAFLPAGLGMIFPTQMRDYYENRHQSRHIAKYGILDRNLLERQRAREEKESFADLFR
tara:strand:+ start:196 stop:510 length:315 start_codon:yes stop_codon:yes gene_type:complete